MTDEPLRAVWGRLARAERRVMIDRDEALALTAKLDQLAEELTAVWERARAELDRRAARWRGPPDTLVCHAVRWVVFADP